MDDYHEFRKDYAVEIEVWRLRWSLSYVSITHDVVGTSGGVNGGINRGTGADTSGSINADIIGGTSGGTSGVARALSSFSPIVQFFKRLKKNYQEVKTKKLMSLLEFERKTGEGLRAAYTRMRHLILVTSCVIEAQAVQFWYRILDKELWRRVRDVIFMSNASPTLANVFALSRKIELNMMEEKVVIFTFCMNTTTSSYVHHATS